MADARLYLHHCYYGDDGHRGIDIAGSGIYASRSLRRPAERSAYSGWMDSYGYCVFIDHAGRLFHPLCARERAGLFGRGYGLRRQTIAYVGSTGNSTGPHLHFEVLQSGSTTNPFEYF